MATETVQIMEGIYDENDRVAARVQEKLAGKGVYAINVMGSPGAGKTSCLTALIRGLKGIHPYVIEGDIESDIDTRALRELGVEAVQINTGGACHLDGAVVENTLGGMALAHKGLLFIENIGNLVCPAEFSIGENMKMLVSSVAEGADKPYKYPLAFQKSSLILLNKVDLLPYVDFDTDYFVRGIRALNPDAAIFFVSAKTGEGFGEVCAWIRSRL